MRRGDLHKVKTERKQKQKKEGEGDHAFIMQGNITLPRRTGGGATEEQHRIVENIILTGNGWTSNQSNTEGSCTC